MNKKILTASLLGSAIMLSSCGGSGGGGLPPGIPSSTVSGEASDAILTNGDIQAYAWDNGVQGELLGESTIDSNGHYDLDIKSKSRLVILVVSNGRYIEEASGVSIQMVEGQTMSAIFFYEEGTDINIQIHPYTHLASCLAKFKVQNGVNTQNAVTAATSAFSALTGVDIIGTFPLNITDPENASFDINDGLRLGSALAGISSFTAQTSIDNGVTPHRFNANSSIFFTQLACQDIQADGLLNGFGFINNGSSIGQLTLGSIALSTDTYRLKIPQNILSIMSSEKNTTGLTVDRFVQYANSIALSTDSMFGNEPPQAVDQEGPVVTSSLANLAFVRKGISNISYKIQDPLGIKDVVFEINGLFHSNGQSDNPVLTLNSESYPDGEIIVKVIATDALNNKSESIFTYNINNTSAVTELTSQTLVNTRTYLATGTYQQNGADIASIIVNSIEATIDTNNQTWSAPLNLTSGSNSVEVVITDLADISGVNNFNIDVDLIFPSITPFSTSVRYTTFQNQLNLCNPGTINTPTAAKNNPICISTNNVHLGGVGLSGNIQNDGYALLGFAPSDTRTAGAGVFTPLNDLIVEYKYEINNTEIISWTSAPKASTNEFYYFPMVDEYLGDKWWSEYNLNGNITNLSSNDIHKITFKVTDKAGNSSELLYEVKVDVITPPTIVTTNVNTSLIVGTSFSNRQSIDGQLINIEYTLDNIKGQTFYISLDELSNHTIDQTYETKIRKNRGRLNITTEWRAKRMREGTNRQTLLLANNAVWTPITSYFKSRSNSGTIILPAVINNQFSDLQKDILTATTTAWANHITCSDTSIRHQSVDLKAIGDNYICGDGKVYFQERKIEAAEYEPGFPKNESINTTVSAVMTTQNISVFNDSVGQQIFPADGFYRVPARSTVKIIKQVNTGILQHFNDISVAQPDFTNYAAKKLDSVLTYNFDTDLMITRVINPQSQSSATETVGNGIESYVISR